MLYNVENKEAMLDALNNRVSSIVDVCIALIEEGYIPNKNKNTKLSWSVIMIDVINNIDVFSATQHNEIEELYSKVMAL